MPAKKLPISFFLRSDVIRISKELLGKYLFTRFQSGDLTGGLIVETEAYAGAEDRASHAYGNRRTQRTNVMFHRGGVAYVYLCYGIHALFNIVTNVEGIPDAILIRAIHPTHGLQVMLRRTGKRKLDYSLTSGPGKLTQALGIAVGDSGTSLLHNKIWLEEGTGIRPVQIEASTRVGIQYAGAHAKRQWRFRLRDSSWISRAK